MNSDFKKEFFSIPNLLGYFRLLLIPVYLFLFIHAESSKDYYIAAFVMFLSFLSDFLDGKIARHFDMVTEFGKMLDPIADKLTQGVLFISFASRFRPVALLLIVFIIKELFMGISSLYLMKRGWNMNGAKLHGKICTFILDFSMIIFLLWPNIHREAVLVLTTACVTSIFMSFTLYLDMFYHACKEFHKKDF